jgi:hypothetical protein
MATSVLKCALLFQKSNYDAKMKFSYSFVAGVFTGCLAGTKQEETNFSIVSVKDEAHRVDGLVARYLFLSAPPSAGHSGTRQINKNRRSR